MVITKHKVINRKTYNDPNGNEYAYEVCSFVFDRVELLGDLEVVVRGQNSLKLSLKMEIALFMPR